MANFLIFYYKKRNKYKLYNNKLIKSLHKLSFIKIDVNNQKVFKQEHKKDSNKYKIPINNNQIN